MEDRCEIQASKSKYRNGDYFDITYLYQHLVYWKKIAVQIGISLKTF